MEVRAGDHRDWTMRTLSFIVWSLLVTVPALAQHDDHAAHQQTTAGAQAPAFQLPVNEKLPPASDRALAAIDKSPRHGEWVSVPYAGGPAIKSWVVYPERKEKAPIVIVIHTNQGLNDWARAVADQLAEDGYIAIAPDLLSGLGVNGGATDSFASADEARTAISGVTPVEAAKRLDAVHAYAIEIPAANGKTATMGFCWGGARSFEYAVAQPALDAAIVFYGTAPQDAGDYGKITAAILGLYGGDDARVNATIDPASMDMKKLGKVFEHEIYEGAGHGFVGAQAERAGANYRATERAWPRALAFLQKHLR
jgi:carboxymethylenebutenolidase